jgi:UPF0755 protein
MFKKIKIKKSAIMVFCSLLFVLCFFVLWETYVPAKPGSRDIIKYIAESGKGDEDIAWDLEKIGIIKNRYFFEAYVVLSFQHSKLQAGKYAFSPGMSVHEIVKKFVKGDIIKAKITIIEGWDVNDIAKYFEEKEICSKDDFINSIYQNYRDEFNFLSELPGSVSLEGYLFPDTYEISEGELPNNILRNILANFEKKITPELKEEILSQKKSVFEIITMASIIEKEVRKMEDKKIVSGLLWKRLETGMPLQVDATVNYITGKNHRSALIADTRIDSPYNTYKYKGLPLGPISNPGMDSILAAIYPTESKYWYYLSAVNGKTIFSETLQKHNIARIKYLR